MARSADIGRPARAIFRTQSTPMDRQRTLSRVPIVGRLLCSIRRQWIPRLQVPSVAADNSFRVRLHRRDRSTNPDRSSRHRKARRRPMQPRIFASCVVSTANQTCSTAAHRPCHSLRKTASAAKAVRLRSRIALEAGLQLLPALPLVHTSSRQLQRNPTNPCRQRTLATFAS